MQKAVLLTNLSEEQLSASLKEVSQQAKASHLLCMLLEMLKAEEFDSVGEPDIHKHLWCGVNLPLNG
jgi:hypothetical protein